MSNVHLVSVVSERRKWLVGLVAMTLVAISAMGSLGTNTEPSYKGKSLSEWMILRSKTPQSNPNIEEAISQIGTNGVSYYVHWIQYERPSEDYDNETYRATGATLAFETLGKKAVIALDDLVRLATGLRISSTNGEQRLVAIRATIALPWLGEQALPPLIKVLTNRNNLVPWVAAEAIGNMGSNALPAIPALVECVGSTNGRLAWRAMDSLGKLRLEPDHVIPVLVNQLSNPDPFYRTCAAESLGNFGAQAVKAEPILRSMLNETNAAVLEAVNTALNHISDRPAINIPP